MGHNPFNGGVSYYSVLKFEQSNCVRSILECFRYRLSVSDTLKYTPLHITLKYSNFQTVRRQSYTLVYD